MEAPAKKGALSLDCSEGGMKTVKIESPDDSRNTCKCVYVCVSVCVFVGVCYDPSRAFDGGELFSLIDDKPTTTPRGQTPVARGANTNSNAADSGTHQAL